MTDSPAVKPELNDASPGLTNHLFDFVRQGDLESIRKQLENGLPADSRDENGNSLLMQACHDGHYPISKILLAQGADVNAASNQGNTPLMFAAMFNQTDIIELLLEHGADAYAKSADGLTALALARAMGAEAAARRLAQHVELF